MELEYKSGVAANKKDLEPTKLAEEPKNHSSYSMRRNVIIGSILPLKRRI